MDESRKPSDAAPAKDSWPKQESSADSLGVTGMFSTVPENQREAVPDELPVTSEFVPEGDMRRVPPARSKAIQEPVVHKVVMPGGTVNPPVDLLERLRTPPPSTETPGAPVPAVSPTATNSFTGLLSRSVPGSAPATPGGPAGGQGSEGLTQLMRALSGDFSPQGEQKDTQVKPVAQSAAHVPAESEFTSLLRTLHTESGSERSEATTRPVGVAPPSGSDGFTAMVRGLEGVQANAGGSRSDSAPEFSSQAESPMDRPFSPAAAPANSDPGTLTRFFSGLESGAASPAVAGPPLTNPAAFSGSAASAGPSEPASFTQLIRAIDGTPAAGSEYQEQRPSGFGDLSRDRGSAREDFRGTNELPSGSSGWPPVGSPQGQAAPASGGREALTDVLRNLSGHTAPTDLPRGYPGGTNSPTISIAGDSLFPAGRAPDLMENRYSPPSAPVYPSVPPTAVTRPASNSQWEPVSPAGGAPVSNSGPSDATKIWDASRLREVQRQAVPPAAPTQPTAPLSPTPAPAGPPNLAWQAQLPPAPVPGQPLQYASPMAPQPPYLPPAPAVQMPTPAPRPAPGVPPAMGKMQQYLPLLLIIIIFLLVVILVTVVFLLKH